MAWATPARGQAAEQALDRRMFARSGLLLGCVACRVPDVANAQEHDHGFPHLATYLIDTHVSDAAREVISRSDLAVIDAEVGARDRRQLEQIRADRPDGGLFVY